MRILSLALDPDLLSQMSNVLQPEEREEQNIYITLSTFPLAEQVDKSSRSFQSPFKMTKRKGAV